MTIINNKKNEEKKLKTKSKCDKTKKNQKFDKTHKLKLCKN